MKNNWLALLQQRCPSCHKGHIFRTAAMCHTACPVCHTVFEREPGYFIGAMYFSYALAIVFLLPVMLFWYLVFPDWDPLWIVALSGLTFLPLAPVVHRYSKVIWIYFDRWAWPENAPK